MIDSAARDPLIGSFFNNYRIDELLALGGMGAVYLVRDATLPNIRKVLKVILPELANNAFIEERFLREAEAVSVLKHPNIVGIDAIGTLADSRLCMLIPFLEGKPLDRVIAEHGGRLMPHRVMHIVAHIARGLDYAHRQGIVHRDLKPGNVFVEPTEDDRYFCKVLDFGIAKQLNARSKRPSPTLAGPMGTPCYMAVEQFANAADVTPAADVYALAIMVWQMVTGHLPWGEQDPAVLYQKQLHEPPNRPVGNHLSPEWEAILRSALSPDPRLRPQSMRRLVQALASALPAIEPLAPSGAGILRTVARKLLRRKLASLGIAAAVLAGLVTLALVARWSDRSSAPLPEAARQPVGRPATTTAPAASPPIPPPQAAAPPAATGSTAPTTTTAAPNAPAPAATVAGTTAPTAAQPAPAERAIAAPGPAAIHRTTPAEPSAPSSATPPSAEAVSSGRLKPKTSPTQPTPARRSADAPGAGAGGHHFDPDAVGGQEQE